MKPPLYSIVIPVFGEDFQFLDRCLFSLVLQTDCPNFEAIIVFDGPNQAGEQRLNELVKKHHLAAKVRSLTIAHGGAPKARNAGAALATGTYLLFLDVDSYLYENRLQLWHEAFEDSGADMIWGNYDILLSSGDRITIGGKNAPRKPDGKFDSYVMKSTNYVNTAFPMKRDKFIPWTEELKSLQDWDMWLNHLDAGHTYQFIDKSFFLSEQTRPTGISQDSTSHWIDRWQAVRKRHQQPLEPDLLVASYGAPHHALHVAKNLGCDILSVPSFKPHTYKALLMLGFYTNSPETTRQHFEAFTNGPKGMRKIIYWIGTDIFQLLWTHSFMDVKNLVQRFADEGFVHLCEADFTQKELADLGIKAQVIPMPPGKFYDPMRLPKEFTIAIYDNPGQRMYHEALTAAVVNAMPDIKFVSFGNDAKRGQVDKNVTHLGYVPMETVLEQSSAILRLTVHDGLPITPLEFISAGRSVYTNVPMAGVHQVKPELADIVKTIRLTKHKLLDSAIRKDWQKKLSVDTFKKAIFSVAKGQND